MAGESILIVDDNLINLKLTKLLLSIEGYDLLTANDAAETFEILKTFEPELILMDIQLPGMDGLTLTRILKSDPKTMHVIIIAVTAFAMKGDQEKALDAGCDGYIIKPINTVELPKILATYLKKNTISEKFK